METRLPERTSTSSIAALPFDAHNAAGKEPPAEGRATTKEEMSAVSSPPARTDAAIATVVSSSEREPRGVLVLSWPCSTDCASFSKRSSAALLDGVASVASPVVFRAPEGSASSAASAGAPVASASTTGVASVLLRRRGEVLPRRGGLAASRSSSCRSRMATPARGSASSAASQRSRPTSAPATYGCVVRMEASVVALTGIAKQ
mmetsp:Transcript_28196/g.93725  ORF Transcript_28196/g.93725 Transcript_28196/m.93725 type:complete len:204 (-) Transcript_28196:141-752(-)